MALRFEGGDAFSGTMREILRHYHGVEVGAYSYGECMNPGAFPAGVVVGRYVSVAADVRIFLRNHPFERLSMHPFFYNSALGIVPNDTITTGTLEIGHDVWIGERAIFTPGCKKVGLGAVVGAGSVVTKDVPDFAMVAGNPARLLRYRFTDIETQEAIRASHWWDQPVNKLRAFLDDMTSPLDSCGLTHPLLTKQSATYHPGHSR